MSPSLELCENDPLSFSVPTRCALGVSYTEVWSMLRITQALDHGTIALETQTLYAEFLEQLAAVQARRAMNDRSQFSVYVAGLAGI